MLSDLADLRRVGDQAVVDLPGVEHRFREDEACVARQRVLIQIAAVADYAEDRDLPIIENVSQRIAGFEQTGALNHHERRRAAEVEAGRDFPRFAFATDADQARSAS